MSHGWHVMPGGMTVGSAHAIVRHGGGNFPGDTADAPMSDTSYFWKPPVECNPWPCMSVAPDPRQALSRVADWSAATGGHTGERRWSRWKEDYPGVQGTWGAVIPRTTSSLGDQGDCALEAAGHFPRLPDLPSLSA